MSDLLSNEVLRLQYKWDVFLLTNFFNNKHYKVNICLLQFCRKNDISVDEVSLLKRLPIQFRHSKKHGDYIYLQRSDVYCFVARDLKTLYKYIEPKSIEDVFDIAEELKLSNIDTKYSFTRYAKEFQKIKFDTRKLSELVKLADRDFKEQLGKGSKSNMAFFQARK